MIITLFKIKCFRNLKTILFVNEIWSFSCFQVFRVPWSVSAVLFQLSCSGCPILAVLYGCCVPVVTVLTSCPDLSRLQARLTCLGCPVEPVLCRLTCPFCLVPVTFPCCPVMAVLPQLSCPSCLVLVVVPQLLRLSCPGCYTSVSLSRYSFPAFLSLNLANLSSLSCLDCSVQTGLSRLS
jgi:hypothetical protein